MLHTTLPLLVLLAGGDDPVRPAFGVPELQAHYAAAETELRAAPVEHLSATQRARRLALLDVLAAYRVRGDFGIADDPAAVRPLRFVDAEGRRCAVAELLHASGRDDLVAAVAASDNEAFVAELAGLEGLGAWLDDVGLTLDEAARIQGPSRGTNWGRSDGRPGDTVGRGNGAGPASGPVTGTGPAARAPRPTTGGLPTGPSSLSGPGADSGPVTPEMQELLGADWWAWWEFAKVGFLGEGRPTLDDGGPSDDRTQAETRRDSVVRRALPALRAYLDDDEAAVRAAAAVTYGRVAGAEAVAPLRALLGDASLEVREAALLGLGATASEEAAFLLLEVAHGRDVDGLDRWRDAEELAVLALGLLREREAGTGVDGMLPAGDGLLDEAAFVHAALAPSERLVERARERSALFQDGRRPRYEREGHFADALAIEALREDPGDPVLQALLRASAERDVERRRSAVTTLGVLGDTRADGPLRTAYETESDPVARGLALIALANTGAPGVEEFLAGVLDEARSLDRPWAALALGVLAREHGVDSASAALRDALERERNRDNRRAIALALGIARDDEAVPALLERMTETSDAGSRVAYGYALGLIGDPRAGDVLRAAVEAERFALPRSELAQALAVLRRPGDVDALVAVALDANDPDASVQSAGAVSFHGDDRAVALLLDGFDDARSPAARASALLAVGLLLDEGEPFSLAGELRDRNPFVAPEWFLRAVQTTL